MVTGPSELLIGLAVAALFLVPAVLRPALGRALVGVFFLGRALVNLVYTLPNLPGSLEGPVATASVPLYRAVVQAGGRPGASQQSEAFVFGRTLRWPRYQARASQR